MSWMIYASLWGNMRNDNLERFACFKIPHLAETALDFEINIFKEGGKIFVEGSLLSLLNHLNYMLVWFSLELLKSS